jgi:hypothetical protein
MGIPTYMTMEEFNVANSVTYAGSFSVDAVPVSTMEDFNRTNSITYAGSITSAQATSAIAGARTMEDFNRTAGYSYSSSITW